MIRVREAGDKRFVTITVDVVIVTAVARFADSIFVGDFDPGIYAPGFLLAPAPRTDRVNVRKS
jgi:hypothetical protein